MKLSITAFLLIALVSAKAQVVTTPDSAKFFDKTLSTVCGKIVGSTMTKSNVTMLNFSYPYPSSPFTAVIFAGDTLNFKDYRPVDFLKNKNVCVTGMIKMYNERPEIIIKSPDQVKIQ